MAVLLSGVLLLVLVPALALRRAGDLGRELDCCRATPAVSSRPQTGSLARWAAAVTAEPEDRSVLRVSGYNELTG